MDREKVVQVVEKACPFARKAGMHIEEIDERKGRVALILEDNPENLNAFGLVHAGAICGFVETAGGMAIMRHIDPREVILLNTVFNIRFSHPPRGDLRCSARFTNEEADALMEEFEEVGRADKAIDLKVFDSSGNLVAQAQATFRLISTPEKYKKHFSG
ncbi:MAG: PaaI family thioesterase [Actinomycetota bacterium]|nr:PaaI family thioesterase [Actinomycetota bacterium]